MSYELYEVKKIENDQKYGLGYRHIIVGLLFVYFGLGSAHKMNLSLGIVSMLNNSENPTFPQFEWSEEIRGYVLSSLYWGYGLAPFFGGILGHWYGPTVLTAITMAVGGTLTILIPFAANAGWIYVCVTRFIIGLTHGFIYPCSYMLISKWLAPHERSFNLAILFIGEKLGLVSTMVSSGFIAISPMGWPGIFYITGAVGVVWAVFWYIFGADSPAKCRRISMAEKSYIGVKEEKTLPVPWGQIIRSIPAWTLLITSMTSCWIIFLLLNEIPTYINGVLRFSIQSNAFASAAPYIFMFFMVMIFNYICDWLINRKYLSIGAARKVFNTIGTCCPAATVIGLGYVEDNVSLALILLIATVALNAADNLGFVINHIDLAPNFAGVLVGVTAVAMNISSIIGPIFVGYVVTDTHDLSLWRIVFFATAAILVIGNTIFIFFGSGEIQKWNDNNNDHSHNGTINDSTNNKIESISQKVSPYE